MTTMTTTLHLPSHVSTCLFDLDGVLTDTAALHAEAWKRTFDDDLSLRSSLTGEPLRPFRLPEDYERHVDGRLRADGVRSFLASRGITIPEGSPDDDPDADTVHGIGARKNALVRKILEQRGVGRHEGSVAFAEAARENGLRRAVVSASANCEAVLRAAGLTDLFEVRVDGIVAAELHLRGKPEPDTYLEAARRLDVEPAHAAVFEDALDGVRAGHAGSFGWVVGIDRRGDGHALRDAGADVVVHDLSELMEST
jgi:beta-phosphoglucomutase family hydrolase